MRIPVPTVRLAALLAVLSPITWLLPARETWSVWSLAIDYRFGVVLGIAAAVAFVDVFMARSTRRVIVRRVFPASITLGNRASLSWEVSTTNHRRASVAVAEELAPSLQAETRRFRVDVPPSATVTARVGVEPARRGRFALTEVVIRSFGPLGMMARQRRVPMVDEIRVLPQYRSAKEAEMAIRRARSLELGMRMSSGRGDGTEFESLRELTPDDSTRRIDWAATARSQRPIVRTYRVEQNQQVVCIMDSGRVMAGQVAGVPRLEWAMDGAMLLADVSTSMSDRFGLVAFDREPVANLAPSARGTQRNALAETLFDLEPALIESDYGAMMRYAAVRFTRRSLIVLITEFETEALETYLLPALPYLVARHVVVVAAVTDPQVIAWAAGEVSDDVDGLLLQATAEGELSARQRLAGRIKSMGAIPLDEPPDRFGTALGDHYLNSKAVGRL